MNFIFYFCVIICYINSTYCEPFWNEKKNTHVPELRPKRVEIEIKNGSNLLSRNVSQTAPINFMKKSESSLIPLDPDFLPSALTRLDTLLNKGAIVIEKFVNATWGVVSDRIFSDIINPLTNATVSIFDTQTSLIEEIVLKRFKARTTQSY